MVTIDPAYLERTAMELQHLETQLNREVLRLNEFLVRLGRIESAGMDRVRYVIRRKLMELQRQIRTLRALYQALLRICQAYRRTEDRCIGLFEAPVGPPRVVWAGISLQSIRDIL